MKIITVWLLCTWVFAISVVNVNNAAGAELPSVPLIEQTGDDACFKKDWQQEVLEFNLKTMVTTYEQTGVKNPLWDAAAKRLLRQWAYNFSGIGIGGGLGSKELHEVVRKLVQENNCPDPMVLYCVGKTYESWRDSSSAKKYYQQAYAAMNKGACLALRKSFMVRRMIEGYTHIKNLSKKQEQELAGMIEECLAYIEELYVTGEYKGTDRLMVEHFCIEFVRQKKFNKQYLDGLLAIFEKKPGDWAALNMIGWVHIQLAWWYRGGGWGNTVTEDGWIGFKKHMSLAKKNLIQSWVLHPESPLAAVNMITVAMSSKTELSERNWFDRAVSAQCDYVDAYNKYEFSLRPRWGGSHEKMLAFAMECAHTECYDSDIPDRLFAAMDAIFSESWQFKKPQAAIRMFANKKLWAAVEKLCMYKIEKGQAGVNWYKTSYMIYALKFGKKELAQRLYREIDGQMNRRRMGFYRVKYTEFEAEEKTETDPLEDF